MRIPKKLDGDWFAVPIKFSNSCKYFIKCNSFIDALIYCVKDLFYKLNTKIKLWK